MENNEDKGGWIVIVVLAIAFILAAVTNSFFSRPSQSTATEYTVTTKLGEFKNLRKARGDENRFFDRDGQEFYFRVSFVCVEQPKEVTP
jgi:hypothetical protein